MVERTSTSEMSEQPSGQEKISAVARLIEMANQIGVQVPPDATIAELQEALVMEEALLQEQVSAEEQEESERPELIGEETKVDDAVLA